MYMYSTDQMSVDSQTTWLDPQSSKPKNFPSQGESFLFRVEKFNKVWDKKTKNWMLDYPLV